MMLTRGFQDPDAPGWVVWGTMCGSLVILQTSLVWTVLAFVAVGQHPPSSLQAACAGTVLWPLLLSLGIFTAMMVFSLARIAMNAQSGMQLPGHSWPHHRKRQAVTAAAVAWLALWVTSGASSQTRCATDRLAGNSVRRMVAGWFFWHLAIVLLVGSCIVGEHAHLWWRRRHVRLEREAYCASQVGVEGTGAGRKVLI